MKNTSEFETADLPKAPIELTEVASSFGKPYIKNFLNQWSDAKSQLWPKFDERWGNQKHANGRGQVMKYHDYTYTSKLNIKLKAKLNFGSIPPRINYGTNISLEIQELNKTIDTIRTKFQRITIVNQQWSNTHNENL